jgi:hypothetical protein
MKICPNCTLPFTGGFVLEAEYEVKCDHCGWSGKSSDLLLTISDSYTYDEEVRLKKLFIRISREISPHIGAALIQEGFIEGTEENIPQLAGLLKDISEAVFGAIIINLSGGFVDGGSSETVCP